MGLREIEARLAQIKLDMDAEGADIDALTTEVDGLLEQRSALIKAQESRSALLGKIASGTEGKADGVAGAQLGSLGGEPAVSEAESRAKAFVDTNKLTITGAESRSLLLSDGKIATPTKVSDFSESITGVSSIIDMVTVEDCTGMSEDNVPYEDTEAEASDKVEGTAATESSGTFGIVSIKPSLKSLISYVSKEIKNQTNLDYTAKVQEQGIRALRRAAVKVVTDAVINSSLKKEVTDIAAIDDKTLRKIVLNYGSDDTVEGDAVLFLNKADLVAFGDIRGEKEKKAVYEITPDGANPNTGIIKDGGLSVRYCINSKCAALTGTTNSSTSKTLPTMFYGKPKAVKLDLFGDYTIETSTDYKFAEGLLAILSEARIGSELVVKNGMVVISLPKKSG